MRLPDPRLPAVQRQALAVQLGRVQGNRRLQSVVGPAPPAPAGGPPTVDPAAQAAKVKTAAQLYRQNVLLAWRRHLASLNVGALETAAQAIVTDWGILKFEERRLDQQVNAAVAPPQQPAAPGLGTTSPGTGLAEVNLARAQVEETRQTIGLVVGLQEYKGQAVLGSFKLYDPGADPTLFVLRQLQRAVGVVHTIHQIRAICQAPEGRRFFGRVYPGLASQIQERQIVQLMLAHTAWIEYHFIVAALRDFGCADQVYQAQNRSKEFRRHYTKIREQAYLTRDEQEADLGPVMLAQMQTDAALLSKLLNPSWQGRIFQELGGDAGQRLAKRQFVQALVGRYQTPRQRDVFFKLLEYRNLLDLVLKYGDTAAIEAMLDTTTLHKGRRYNAALDPDFSFIKTFGGEALRQTPGAVCHFMAGVYDGLAHLPVVGDVFSKSAASFRELGGYMDEATGASTDGREWRNRVASFTGTLDSMLLQYGVSAETAAAEGIGLVYKGAQVVDASQTVLEIIEQIQDLRAVVDSAPLLWNSVLGALDAIATLQLVDVASGDWIGALDSIDRVLDPLIANAGKVVSGGWTGAAAEERQAQAARREYQDAVREFNQIAKRLGTKKPEAVSGEDKVDLLVAKGRLEAAARRQQAGVAASPVLTPKGSWLERVKHGAQKSLRATLVTIAVKLLQTLKTALKDAVKQAAQSRRLPNDTLPRQVLANAILGGFDETASALAGFAVKELKKYGQQALTPLVMKAIRRKFPELVGFQPFVERGMEQLATGLVQAFDVANAIEKPLKELGGRLAARLLAEAELEGKGSQPLSPQAGPPVRPSG